jgi:hypothetical protein
MAPNLPSPSPSYHSYLLRLWQDDAHAPWRIQLEDPHTGERRGFASLAHMLEFLDQQMAPPQGQGNEP